MACLKGLILHSSTHLLLSQWIFQQILKDWCPSTFYLNVYKDLLIIRMSHFMLREVFAMDVSEPASHLVICILDTWYIMMLMILNAVGSCGSLNCHINCHITQSVDHASSNVKVMGSNFQGKQELMKQKCNAKCTNVNMALEDLSTYGSLLLYYVFFLSF